MSEKWVPKIGTLTIPAEVKKPRVNREAILNPLTKGTPIRATHGENVLVGVVGHTSSDYGQTVWIHVPLKRKWHPDSFALDLSEGWQIEIVGTPKVVPGDTQ